MFMPAPSPSCRGVPLKLSTYSRWVGAGIGRDGGGATSHDKFGIHGKATCYFHVSSRSLTRGRCRSLFRRRPEMMEVVLKGPLVALTDH